MNWLDILTERPLSRQVRGLAVLDTLSRLVDDEDDYEYEELRRERRRRRRAELQAEETALYAELDKIRYQLQLKKLRAGLEDAEDEDIIDADYIDPRDEEIKRLKKQIKKLKKALKK